MGSHPAFLNKQLFKCNVEKSKLLPHVKESQYIHDRSHKTISNNTEIWSKNFVYIHSIETKGKINTVIWIIISIISL